MAKKLYDLAVKTGEYQDRTTGQNKGRWQNVGAVMQGDDGGKFIMLAKWFNPAGVPDLSGRGGESILLSMFEPQQNNGGGQGGGNGNGNGGGQQQARQQRQQSRNDDYNEDIPF